MCSFLCNFFQKKIVFLLSKKNFFLKFFFKFFFLLNFTSNLLSFTTFYSVLPRLVLSFTKYPAKRVLPSYWVGLKTPDAWAAEEEASKDWEALS